MKPKSRFFRTDFPAALAIALVVQTSPARAEVVTLVCQDEKSGDSFTLRVDYDRKIVDLLSPDGTTILSEAATITESNVSWEHDNSKWDYSSFKKTQGFNGSLNRLSGQGSYYFFTNQNLGQQSGRGPCRRATQKF